MNDYPNSTMTFQIQIQ